MVESEGACWIVSPNEFSPVDVEYSIYICGSRRFDAIGWQTLVIDRLRTLPIAIFSSGLGKRVSFSDFLSWREKTLRIVDGVLCWISKDSDWSDFLELGSILRIGKQLWIGIDFDLENFEYLARAVQEIRSDIYIFSDIRVAIEHVYRYYAGELEPTQVIGMGNPL